MAAAMKKICSFADISDASPASRRRKMNKNLAVTTASVAMPDGTMRWVFPVRLRTVFTSSTHPFRVRR
jgi:hypothetical protein